VNAGQLAELPTLGLRCFLRDPDVESHHSVI
jgi:hypothetical protein